MRIQEKPQPHRSRSVIALMAKRLPMSLEPHMGPEAVRHMRESCQYLPALRPESPEAQIIEHIHNGEEREALDLLHHGANPRAMDEVGLTLLHHAGAAGMLLLADRLMDQGAYPDAVSIVDESVLTYVILSNAEGPNYKSENQPGRGNGKNNVLAIVDRLIRRGANLDQPDMEGNTAALHTAYIGDMDVMTRLKKAGADLRCRNFDEADVTYRSAQAGHHRMLEQYLHWGIDPRSHENANLSARDAVEAMDNKKCINMLARGEVIAQAREIAGLSLVGADLTRIINNLDAFREVHEQAVWRSDTAVCRVSLEIVSEMCGFEAIDPKSFEMFMLSNAAHNNEEFVLSALKRGVDATATDPYGRTGLMLQAMHGFYALMEPLIHSGCPVNAQGALLESALHCAAMTQNSEGVRTLLAMGANPFLKNWRGLTPRQQMILHYQTPVSDETPRAPLVTEDVQGSFTKVSLSGKVQIQQGPAAGSVTVFTIGKRQEGGYEVDPVILAMLEFAESRWLRGEANYQAAQRRAKVAPS